jgi:hypothetical protein
LQVSINISEEPAALFESGRLCPKMMPTGSSETLITICQIAAQHIQVDSNLDIVADTYYGFVQSLHPNSGIVYNSGYDHFLSHPFPTYSYHHLIPL